MLIILMMLLFANANGMVVPWECWLVFGISAAIVLIRALFNFVINVYDSK